MAQNLNENYAKIVYNNQIEFAPEELVINGTTVLNPSNLDYLNAGYVKFHPKNLPSPQDDDVDLYYYQSTYEIINDEIYQDWEPVAKEWINLYSDMMEGLKKYDYIGVKIAMGVATKEEYADKIRLTEKYRYVVNQFGTNKTVEQVAQELEELFPKEVIE